MNYMLNIYNERVPATGAPNSLARLQCWLGYTGANLSGEQLAALRLATGLSTRQAAALAGCTHTQWQQQELDGMDTPSSQHLFSQILEQQLTINLETLT